MWSFRFHVRPESEEYRLKGQGAKRDSFVEKTPDVRIESPYGLGQADEDIQKLIENWIVPQLIRVFLAETSSQTPSSADKRTFTNSASN
jgi:hypothetical protein